ncbi:MAG: DJ-1/PfpI family protein [Dysgonamonadaceae bacterium]|jgi:4-methyl-5(b-hydroxyethyl)-thiazole monophosphate biosynthesis|nr:DJ-1/PfpI family protein [Dysgonamonadaceae bacterium]
MKKAFIFLATGFEETEAVATIDVILRGGIDLTVISVTGDKVVEGAHGIRVLADSLFEETDFCGGDILVLPGGMPGASNLRKHKGLEMLIQKYFSEKKKLAAICAAPLVFGEMGLLEGKKATCYPGYEKHLKGASIKSDGTVIDENFITGKGPAFAIDFGLAIVGELQGKAIADEVSRGLLVG